MSARKSKNRLFSRLYPGSALQPTARCDATFNYSRWEPPRLSALYGR